MIITLGLFSCGESSGNDIPSDTTPLSTNVEDIITEIEGSQADIAGMDFEFSKRDNEDSYQTKNAVKVVFSGESAKVEGNGAVVDGKTVTLKSETTYILSGSCTDGMLVVDCGDNDKIQIVFDGLDLTNKSGPAIYIKNADKVVITLAEDSENTVSDGKAYEYTDGGSNIDAAIFSKADIAFNGEGKLTVNGNAKHGICSKDDLVVTGGSYEIKSNGVALNGKDCVKIAKGEFTLNAESDGIRSDNEEDENRGYVYIANGKFNIVAGNDGIQAQTVLKIEGGSFDIKAGGGSQNASTNSGGGFNDNWGFGGNDFGGRPGQSRPNNGSSGNIFMSYSSSVSSGESAKGIKAGADILVSGGVFNIDSADDSVHSNGTIEIDGGEFSIKSGDDGIHADTALSISDGVIDITKSYEGIESSDILIRGGKITVVASDDGFNAAGGNDQSSLGNRPGMGGFSRSTGRIAIAGGFNVINAAGDGIDSNGTVTVSGGVTIVYGPTSSGNGSFDYDGTAAISGGTFIAIGSAGMAQSFTSADGQGVIAAQLSVNSGTSIAVCDENGNVVLSVTAKKSIGHMVMSCSGIQQGSTYKIVTGCTVDNADENGYAENTTKSGGKDALTVEMTSNLYGGSGGMGGMGGMMPSGGRR